ncbi:oligopeptide transporter 1 [Linderina pennispora]|uniref:Oligopeptide transporter 1 n=1 Tax=Linderina pennispora TaxID=61395 RepID=A0A1Y1VW79_9FUNG|nr:oligopeptide transporter 1 [Linderina pennispora]ORX65275.1 oligopeptide transporter 1 [Linderina pennispora]
MATQVESQGVHDELQHEEFKAGVEKNGQYNEEEEEEDSPFEMVRVAVSNKDDPDLPCLTFRSWILGIIFAAALAFVNQFFFFRENPITLGGYVVQLLSFPLGFAMSKVLPTRKFRTFGFEWTMNPGKFNIKEHVLISIFAGTSVGVAYAIDVVTIKKMWYKSDMGFGPSVLFLLSSQVMGYSFAGLSREFLVYPSAMIWPATLVSVTLFRTFHEHSVWNGWSRTRMFWVCFAASFAWYWVPATIFPTLSMIAILCFAAPNNVIAQQIGDAPHGLGILNLTLDWSYISSGFTGSPIAIPWVMAANVFAGFVIIMWIITPIGYYTNTWGHGIYPIYTASLYLPDGGRYNISKVMTPDQNLDPVKYEEYGHLRMSFHFGLTYGIGFAGLMTVLSYIALHHGKDIVQRVPQWWYLVTFAITFAMSIIVCEVWNLMNWYWVILSVVLPFIFTIPIGIIQALSNQQPGLNIITEFIIGYGRVGDPIANVTFKVYGYITMAQALLLVSDQKLGHYMKIPPRTLFIAQLVGTIICAFVQLGVAYWLMNTVKDMCTPEGRPWTCIQANTFYSASVIWGLVGPGRMFGSDSPYHVGLYLFIVGVFLPVPFWYLQKRYPNSLWKHVHIPLLFSASGYMPPAPSHIYVNWFIACTIFNYFIHKYRNQWWQRYAFSLSAGLDCGLAISGIVIFFAFQNVVVPTWWGNPESGTHCPLANTGFKPLPEPIA